LQRGLSAITELLVMLSLVYIVLRFVSSAVHPATDDALDSAMVAT